MKAIDWDDHRIVQAAGKGSLAEKWSEQPLPDWAKFIERVSDAMHGRPIAAHLRCQTLDGEG